MKTKRIIFIVSCSLVIIALGLFLQQYYRGFKSNIIANDGESHLIYIYPETSLENLKVIIERTHSIESKWTWDLHCRLLHFNKPKVGCYTLGANEGSITIIRRLRAGEQTPVKLTFNHIRTGEQLAERISTQLMLDSLSIISRLQDTEYMKQYKLNTETAVCLFIPNTYEVFWTISPDALFNRMAREYNHFWNDERTEKATALGLSKTDVATLASICEEETNKTEEYPIIARLYLNRLNKGMALQACPTIKFALQDFTLRRILKKHLQYDSPYNTYKYRGLPPGPIRIPRASTMDAVLNCEQNDYLFMCANSELNGTHHFSRTYKEHARYAREYQRMMNQKGIK